MMICEEKWALSCNDEHLLNACSAALSILKEADCQPIDARFIESCDSVIAGLQTLRDRAGNVSVCAITTKIIGLIDLARTS